jgi:hypothetical protein
MATTMPKREQKRSRPQRREGFLRPLNPFVAVHSGTRRSLQAGLGIEVGLGDGDLGIAEKVRS